MSILEELKKSYNSLIIREKKAEEFFDNPDVEQSKKDSWISEYMKITESLSSLMAEYRTITGNQMADDEIFNGFNTLM